MTTLRKFGGVAALCMAASHLIGMVLFLGVLDYLNLTDPAQRLALIVEKQGVIFVTNLLMYVFFGVALIVLASALYERLHTDAPIGAGALMQAATAVGLIWAGSLIASGMVANAGMGPVVALYAHDPAQAALTWQGIEAVANGLGNANGEILGGLWTLLVGAAALRTGGLPRGAGILGVAVGAVGIASLIPALTGSLVGVFGLGQIVWFMWVGIALLRSGVSRTARTPAALRA